MAIPTCDVRPHGGAPTLFLNDQPHPGCQFWHSRPLTAGEDFQRFAAAGVHLYTTGFPLRLAEDGTLDVSPVAQTMAAILAADPEALVMPRIGLEPSDWWLARYPDEVQVHYDAVNGDEIRRSIAFGSARWRTDMGMALPTMLQACEAQWGEHLLGYHLCAGACGEWAYSWSPVISGYSPAQRAGFQAWLRARYGTVEALRTAWDDASASFATAHVPRGRVRNPFLWPRIWSIFDPARDRQLIDYQRYHSETVAEAIGHFAGIARQALTALGRRKLLGVFYGYHFGNVDTPYVAHNAGHHALATVLASPDVDFISAPLSYHERHAGGLYYTQLLPGSVRLAGKLYYDEDDTFTHRAQETPWRPKCKDAAETAHVLWRNFAGTLRECGAFWWMDHDGEGWYRDDALMAEVAGMAGLAQARLGEDRTPTAQIAVLASPASQAHLRYDAALVDALLPLQLSELISLGAPADYYMVSDVARLAAEPWSANYRFIVVLDALYLSEAERAALARWAKSDGRTVLWCYGAGLLTDTAVSPAAQAALTGLWVRLIDRVGPLRAETYLTGTRLTYGGTRDIGPELVGDDPDAEALGWSLYRGQPVLLRRRFPTWTSLWSGVPTLPAAVLREFARDAGVHLYLETGDRVWADRGLLTVHAAFEGPRTITLPTPATVEDVRTGRLVAVDATEIPLTLRRGETAVWRLR